MGHNGAYYWKKGLYAGGKGPQWSPQGHMIRSVIEKVLGTFKETTGKQQQTQWLRAEP